MDKTQPQNKYDRRRTVWTDKELLTMLDEVNIALAIIDQMPAYTLASNALIHDRHSLMLMADARGIRKYEYPNSKELLKKVHKAMK